MSRQLHRDENSGPVAARRATDHIQTDTSLLRLLQQSRSDDPAAWKCCLDQFYQNYMPVIYSWCRLRGLSEQDALDVGHDLIVDIGRSIKRYSFERPGRFSDWLYVVTRNAVSDFCRREKRRRAANTKNIDATGDSNDLLDHLVAAFETEIRRAALKRVEQETDEINRQIIELRFRSGIAGNKVAEQLGIRPANLYQRVRRIRKQLECVQQELERRGSLFLATPLSGPDTKE